jgi:bifunctional DNA-binding transcriptional regulator/antitoxin component of YhaV-PrlF toxin-antitoxin module
MKKVFDLKGNLKYFETKVGSRNRLTLPVEAIELIGNQRYIVVELIKDGKKVGQFTVKNKISK